MCSPQGETSGSERGKSNGPIKDEKMARSPGAAPGELGFGDPAAQAGALRVVEVGCGTWDQAMAARLMRRMPGLPAMENGRATGTS